MKWLVVCLLLVPRLALAQLGDEGDPPPAADAEVDDGLPDLEDGGWPGRIPASLEDAACIRAASGLDLAGCAGVGVAVGVLGGELGQLEQIRCVLGAINKWQHDRMQCLESQINRRAKTILYPKKVLEPLGMGLKAVQGLRDEVRDMACKWRFRPRVAKFHGMYLERFQWCKNEYEAIFGSGEKFATAGDFDLTKWLGVTTQNLISARTGGKDDHSPEATWQYTATSISRTHLDAANSPGEALRFMATTMADGLRVDNSTLQMQAQQLLVEETRRGLRLKRERAFDAFGIFLTMNVAELDRPQPPPVYEELR